MKGMKQNEKRKKEVEREKEIVLQYACYFKGSGKACAALGATQQNDNSMACSVATLNILKATNPPASYPSRFLRERQDFHP